jgi:FemAB-related protein (PEP-CTERM system-associated)
MSLRVLRFEGDPAAWDAFVATQPDATAAHLYAWKRVIERSYHHDCPYLVAYRGSAIAGVLPLVDVRSAAFGRFLVSMPYLNAGGPLGDFGACKALTAAALELAAHRNARVMELRCTSELPLDLPYSADKIACLLELPESEQALWSGFPAKLRSQLRKPQKEGVTLEFGAQQVDAFFAVFARNMRDLGSPTHSRTFFRVIAEEFREQAWFACAYKDGVPVAAGCAIHWRDEIEMTWASSLREYNALAPNMLVYSGTMERAIAQGIRQFNFGRCTPDTGSHRFKKQWGSRDLPLYWFRWRKGNAGSLPNADHSSLSIATRMWRRIPVPIATLLGPQLRKGIPA